MTRATSTTICPTSRWVSAEPTWRQSTPRASRTNSAARTRTTTTRRVAKKRWRRDLFRVTGDTGTSGSYPRRQRRWLFIDEALAAVPHDDRRSGPQWRVAMRMKPSSVLEAESIGPVDLAVLIFDSAPVPDDIG